ncbi:MAG: selenide, water dikinase SelD [Flammeovirgaceae bacterium TMED32]|nr:MAG: selenide, water dikinase SelD [Flammeovirgaceae bacterium TMED32]
MDYKLTKYSHGAGCGCKIAPQVLDDILGQNRENLFPDLLVGNQDKDDAAVFDLGDGTAVISTSDFFMPIVDDPYNFGRIAAVNAISDIYAMGGNPLMAIAILGWPINEIPAAVAHQVIEGARFVCKQAHIPLAGGHSIDSLEPIFGLAVTGKVAVKNLKKNKGARPGDVLFLTKPLGVGIITTALKKNLLNEEGAKLALASMTQLNDVGTLLATLKGVHAMTDVTGFGLLGHLIEMCEASETSAEINFEAIPQLPYLQSYLDQGSYPGGTTRNWESYGEKVDLKNKNHRLILADPQTSGGLLVAVAPESTIDFLKLVKTVGLELATIGNIQQGKSKKVYVK